MKKYIIILVLALTIFSQAIAQKTYQENSSFKPTEMKEMSAEKYKDWTSEYVQVPLHSDYKSLSEADKTILPLLFRVAEIMNDIYWKQAYGNKEELLKNINSILIRRV